MRSSGDSKNVQQKNDQKLQVQRERVLDRLSALRTFAFVRTSLPLGRAVVAASVTAGECDVLRAVHADRATEFLFEFFSTNGMHLT